MTAAPSMAEVWRRIDALQGEHFETIRGLAFSYSVDGDILVTDRTDYPLRVAEFAKALELVPLAGPSEITKLVRGPSYIWAILHDPRVRASDW